jgi:LPPG:FO 2-phospho-L-lactate transferase
MMSGSGQTPSAVGVAELYQDILDGFVMDSVDRRDQDRLLRLGIEVLVTDAVMHDRADRARLAGEVLDFARRLRRRRPG